GVVLAKSLRRPRQLVPPKLAEEPPELGSLEDGPKPFMVPSDVLPDGSQLVRSRHINAAGNLHAVGRDVEIQAGAAMLFEAARLENGRDMGLVRALVGAEADIAIDAVDGAPRLPRDLGRNRFQLAPKREHQFHHGRFDLVLVNVLVLQKPLTVVVALQAAQELQRFRRESGEFGHNEPPRWGGS